VVTAVRIIASTYTYPPQRFIGAELMTHAMLKALQARGHEIVVHVSGPRRSTQDFDGIPVVRGTFPKGDVLVYHPDMPQHAVDWPGPKVGICHNMRLGVELGLRNTRPDFAVVNSEAMQALKFGNKLTVHPPLVLPDTYSPGRAVTLVNLDAQNKVGPFFDIVDAMPDLRFLGVKGGYGKQQVPKDPPSNLTVIGQVHPDLMRHKVWDRTAILLVPSESESWSMVASEAMAHGIPVIANPLPGLKENLAGAGVWADRDDVDAWVDRIRFVLSTHSDRSAAARSRAVHLADQHARELDVWCKRIEAL
jgi:hypothetical protein